MRSKLDRIEASVQDAEDGRWCSLETVDAAALVAVARAAEDLLRDDDMPNHWDDCVCSYCTRNRSLRDVLSRLGKGRGVTGGNLRNLLAQADDWSRLPSAWETSLRAGIWYDEETQRTLARLIALAPEAVQLLADTMTWIENYPLNARYDDGWRDLLARFGRLDQQAGQQ